MSAPCAQVCACAVASQGNQCYNCSWSNSLVMRVPLDRGPTWMYYVEGELFKESVKSSGVKYISAM